MGRHLNSAIVALTLVRLGQELGSDTPAARAIHDLLELVTAIPFRLFS